MTDRFEWYRSWSRARRSRAVGLALSSRTGCADGGPGAVVPQPDVVDAVLSQGAH